MNLETVRNHAERLLSLWSEAEPKLAGWRFRFNDRKRGLGLCDFRNRVIEVSHLHARLDSQSQILDTILHEIAHALTWIIHGNGVSVHGPEWKAQCIRVGANPKACADANDEGIVSKPGKWVAHCPGCKKEFNWHRKPKHLTGRYCIACGNEKGKLTVAARNATAPTVATEKKSKYF